MCRQADKKTGRPADNPGYNWCSKLGEEWSENWDKECPLRPDSTMNLSRHVETFIDIIKKFVTDSANIDDVIDCAENIALKNWYCAHGQVAGGHRKKIIKRTKSPVSTSMRFAADENCRLKPNEEDNKLKQKILDRDHYHCRYCGNKLIDKRVWENLARIADSDRLKLFRQKLIGKKTDGRNTAGNEDVPGLFFFACPTIDHVVPCTLGGKKHEDNLVSSCYACNFGKDQRTCDQIGIQNPFERLPKQIDWDGLKSILSDLEKKS